MLSGAQVGYADTLKISLAVKKALVDREMLDVTQVCVLQRTPSL